MLHNWEERRYIVEGSRLFLKKKSLGSSYELLRIGQRFLYTTLDDSIIGMVLDYGG